MPTKKINKKTSKEEVTKDAGITWKNGIPYSEEGLMIESLMTDDDIRKENRKYLLNRTNFSNVRVQLQSLNQMYTITFEAKHISPSELKELIYYFQ